MKQICLWICAVTLLAGVAPAQSKLTMPAQITGVRPAECVVKGEQLIIEGSNFGDARQDVRAVLWSAGTSVELTVTAWRDNEITTRVPADGRIVPGRKYQVRLEDRAGTLVGAPGPEVTICEDKKAAKAPAPAAPKISEADAIFQGRQLAQMVFLASGGTHWKKVKTLHFTFHVAQGDQSLTEARHEWDLRAGTDTVTWGGKTVTVNLAKPGTDADAKAAHARWVNDTYWLLAPLKLVETGVRVMYAGVKELNGRKFDVLRTNYPQVGPNPSDQYHFYIDPQTRLVAHWDYVPHAGSPISGTWESYQQFGGLKLATEHQFGEKRVWFTEIQVQ